MRISKIVIKNYRQLRNVNLELNKKGKNDLYLFVAKNGRGKTNLANAINWCLYGDEPSILEREEYPILTKSIIYDSKPGEKHDVVVDVWIEDERRETTIFHRSQTYRILLSKEQIEEKKKRKGAIKPDEMAKATNEKEFTATYSDERGNSIIVKNDDAESIVERFIPRNIREFFLFDGERLDRYFREATGVNIKNATFNISQVDRMRRVQEHTNDILKELREKAASMNPALEQVENEIKEKEEKLVIAEEEVNNCKLQIERAEDKIQEISKKLAGYPDTVSLENQRNSLLSEKTRLKGTLNNRYKEKKEMLYDLSKIRFLNPSIEYALSIIAAKRDAKELPPVIDIDLLKEMKKTKQCKVCDRKLDDISEKRIDQLLSQIGKSSVIGKSLTAAEPSLKTMLHKEEALSSRLIRVNQEIRELEDSIAIVEEKINEIDKKLEGFPLEDIRNLQLERNSYESSKSNQAIAQGAAQERSRQIRERIKVLEVARKREIEKAGFHSEIIQQMDFAECAVRVTKNVEQIIMNEARSDLEKNTNEKFKKLLSKTESFDRVEIDVTFTLHVIDKMLGINSIGALSAGERAILALSFTLALHSVSGFEGPLLIDTPVKSIDKAHRCEIAQALLEVSKSKEVILLFVDTEYGEEVSGVLETEASKCYEYVLGSDEAESSIKIKD